MVVVMSILVSLYILTRMAELFDKKGLGPIPSVLGIITALGSLYALFCIFTKNVPFPRVPF